MYILHIFVIPDGFEKISEERSHYSHLEFWGAAPQKRVGCNAGATEKRCLWDMLEQSEYPLTAPVRL